MAIKGLIFDLYGTLIYLEKQDLVLPTFFKDLGLLLDEGQRDALMINDYQSLTNMAESFNVLPTKGVLRYEEELRSCIDSARLFDESISTLRRLKELDYPIGIVSNLASPYKRALYDLGLDLHADEIVFSCDVGLRKPDKEIYRLISKRMKLPMHDLIMVGDSLDSDYLGAIDSGMHALLLDRKGRYNSYRTIRNLSELI